MNRVKIDIPETFHFSTEIRIRITDINYGGHVGNDSFLALVHEARQLFLLSHGYGELKMEGIGLIMADAAIEFRKELNHGDIVRISVAAAGFDKLGFDLFYLLELVGEHENTVAGKAKTGMMGFDYAQKKKMPIPEKVVKKLTYA